jgi:maleylpyruvate isomerase
VPARTDLATDPAVLDDLGVVRLATASFRRALSQVDDPGFDAPSALPGWTRRHLVAHVGYNARALSRLVVWAATGVETPMYASSEQRAEEIELGSTLRPQALRSLVEHAAIELDVRWRDLPADRWSFPVLTAQGRRVPASETLWMRTREMWLHAVDLRTGVQVADIPEALQHRLVDDVVGVWARRGEDPGWLLREDGGAGRTWGDAAARVTVSGPLPALLAWATGRPGDGVTFSSGPTRRAPRWI